MRELRHKNMIAEAPVAVRVQRAVPVSQGVQTVIGTEVPLYWLTFSTLFGESSSRIVEVARDALRIWRRETVEAIASLDLGVHAHEGEPLYAVDNMFFTSEQMVDRSMVPACWILRQPAAEAPAAPEGWYDNEHLGRGMPPEGHAISFRYRGEEVVVRSIVPFEPREAHGV